MGGGELRDIISISSMKTKEVVTSHYHSLKGFKIEFSLSLKLKLN